MNIKLVLAALAALLPSVAFAQIIGNPFASLGIDFYGFFLPWIFTFAIVFGLLSKLDLFGKTQAQKINMALSFVVAFFVSAVGGPQLALFFTTLFGGASMFLAGIVVILLFATMIGVKFSGEGAEHRQLIALAVVIVIGVLLFLASSGNFIAVTVIGPDMAAMIFWLIIIVAAIWFVTSGKEEKGGAAAGGRQG